MGFLRDRRNVSAQGRDCRSESDLLPGSHHVRTIPQDFTMAVCRLLAVNVYDLRPARRSTNSEEGNFPGNRPFGWPGECALPSSVSVFLCHLLRDPDWRKSRHSDACGRDPEMYPNSEYAIQHAGAKTQLQHRSISSRRSTGPPLRSTTQPSADRLVSQLAKRRLTLENNPPDCVSALLDTGSEHQVFRPWLLAS